MDNCSRFRAHKLSPSVWGVRAVILSGALPAAAFGPLGVTAQWTVAELRAEHLGYLAHHRFEVLRE